MAKTISCKAGLDIGTARVASKGAPTTKTLMEIVDAPSSEIARSQRRALVDLLFVPGALALDDPQAMARAWR